MLNITLTTIATTIVEIVVIFVSLLILSKVFNVWMSFGKGILISITTIIGFFVLNYLYLWIVGFLPGIPYLLQLIQALLLIIIIKHFLGRIPLKDTLILGLATYAAYYLLTVTFAIQNNVIALIP